MSAAAKSAGTPAQVAFIEWLRVNHPSFLAQLEQGGQLGDFSSFMSSVAGGFQNVLSNATNLVGQYVANKQQISLLKANIERAKLGQMPVNSLQQLQMPLQSAGPDWKLWAMIGGAGLLLFLLLRRK